MGAGLRLSFLILSVCWLFAGARIVDISDVTVMQLNSEIVENEVMVSGVTAQDERLCTLCQDFTAQAVDYLSQNKTQTEVIDTLYQACSRLHYYKQQCILLVDYYAPLFFNEVDHMSPEKFCRKVDLCEEKYISLLRNADTCSICHQAVVEILLKLKDPDTQLEIVEEFLKACGKVEHYTQQCKKLVLEYAPLILINGEKFLESTDICAAIHVCRTTEEKDIKQAFLNVVALHDA